MNTVPWLSLIIFTPWIGAAVLALLPRLPASTSRILATVVSLSTLAFGLIAATSLGSGAGYALVERHDWIAALSVSYHLGADDFSLLLVILTGIVGPASVLAGPRGDRDARLFGALMLLLQGCALGVFLSLDFFPWFLFWELSLFPAFFLIKLWGGPNATRAAYQFVVMTIAGSAFMLLGFAAIYAATGTVDLESLTTLSTQGALTAKLASLGHFWPNAVFLGVLLGLAVKVPLVPLHAWLPPTYAEAPTGASMFLTGVMSKMGVYGFIRILWPLFPAQLHNASTPLLWLALAGVVLGALAAMRQTDLKRMVAYSSLNHLNYCLLALFAVAAASGSSHVDPAATSAALGGAILQTFNHGLSAAALFFCIGMLETRSGGLRGLNDFGGVRSVAPVFAGLCGIAMFSSVGLPGLNSFVGEFLIFRGVFALTPWAAAVACIGLLATALFLLTFWQRVFHGPIANETPTDFLPLSGSERAVLIPLAGLMILFGVLPHLLLGLVNPVIASWAQSLLP